MEPDFRAIDVTTRLNSLPVVDVARIARMLVFAPLPIVYHSVRDKIHNHLKQDSMEMGGLLVGKVYESHILKRDYVLVEITESVPSDECRSTNVSLEMGTDVWNKARELLVDGNTIVGWYHSHPNLGAFFSGTDRYTQKHFFHHPYSLGYVVDYIRDEEKWFVGKESEELKQVIILNDC